VPTFHNPVRVDVTERGGGFPWEAVALVLALFAAGGVAHAVAPWLHAVWAVLAIGGTLAGCAVLALAGRAFAQWEKRRAEPEPEVLQWRDGQQMREPRR
jgi:hypothetical protein